MSTDLPQQLERLGDALHAATTAELISTPRAAAPRPAIYRRPRVIAAVLAAAVAAPGIALAAGAFDSPAQVARSIPAGTLALLGTNPTCTTVTAGVEYHCILASVPSDAGGPLPGAWKATVEPTVDAAHRVNGGCRAQNAAGTEWLCYIGEAAVREQIIGQGFLGQHSSGPGVG